MDNTTKIQPTILIKKADGTSERISLDEFKRRKQGKSDQRSVIGDRKSEKMQNNTIPVLSRPVRRAIPLIEESDEQRSTINDQRTVRRSIPLVEETDINQSLVTPPKADPPWADNHQSTTDTRSLLDDDHDEITALAEKHNTTHAPVTSVSFSSSVVIPESLEARTNSLILSWKKGIRDKHQFLLYAVRGIADGGLGLTQVNAEKLFLEISGNAVLGTPATPSRPAPRPMAPVSGMASTSTVQQKSQMQQIPNSSSLIHEIAPTHETSSVVGPIEEAAALTLEDFRRLSRNPKTAGSMLLAKFKGWKDESYLLYLQVRESWRSSPLFRLYIEQTVDAIEKNVPIVSVLQGNLMNYEEYLAITETNRRLAMMD